MSTPDEDVCSICRRGEAPVCGRCRQRMAAGLADLPGLHDRLRAALVPGGTGGERVSTGKSEAPMPARLAALNLLAGGSDEARCLFVPAVRVWTTVEPAPVGPDGGRGRPVSLWHREPVYDDRGRPAMTLADDQSGVLPVRAWLRSWAREWRTTLGHSTTAPGASRARRRNSEIVHAGSATALLGIGPAVAPGERPDDPTEQAWSVRWPNSGWGPATRRYHGYLSAWLPQACDRQAHIGDFAASLRTLTGAIRAALGDTDDLQYLGRCPEQVRDPAGAAVLCGAPIWHDPAASVITCPRCHTDTGDDRRIWLARRIIDVWPIDRRRRYPRGLIEVLREPACAVCGAPVAVQWVPATERADAEAFWRPGNLTCPTGCEVAW